MSKPFPTPNDKLDQILKSIRDDFARHVYHKKKQIGRCVYCVDCNKRLYQGRLPQKQAIKK